MILISGKFPTIYTMSATKNTKNNRKVVVVEYSPPVYVWEIPDNLDLEDKTVVEEWYVRYGTLHIKYVGQDEPEKITDKEQVWGMDMKWGTGKYKHGLIEDADEHGYEYQDDATNTEKEDEEDK